MIAWMNTLPTACPECGEGELFLENLSVGEIVVCPCCGTELTVNGNGNLEVLQLEGEDWGE